MFKHKAVRPRTTKLAQISTSLVKLCPRPLPWSELVKNEEGQLLAGQIPALLLSHLGVVGLHGPPLMMLVCMELRAQHSAEPSPQIGDQENVLRVLGGLCSQACFLLGSQSLAGRWLVLPEVAVDEHADKTEKQTEGNVRLQKAFSTEEGMLNQTLHSRTMVQVDL